VRGLRDSALGVVIDSLLARLYVAVVLLQDAEPVSADGADLAGALRADTESTVTAQEGARGAVLRRGG
jgi:hypothetical protein